MTQLRARTAGDHARVDALFSTYDLGSRREYGSFLRAHARALPAAEGVVSGADVPAYGVRTTLLHADLHKMGEAVPDKLDFAIPDRGASAWGVLYVIEGSRIGGALLARRVPADMPKAYLSSRHERGEWRAFGEALNAEARDHDDTWLDSAVAAAKACFDLYCQSAAVP